MKRIKILNSIVLALILAIILPGCSNAQKSEPVLKDALSGKFYIGAALNTPQITGRDTLSMKMVTRHFNSIVAENCMKSGEIQRTEGEFDFSLADQFVAFGEKHNMHIVGHTLIWHSQAPRWFFTGADGNEVSREVLIERMKNHIYTVVGRYKGRVHGWDVVNEAIEDNGSWRNSKFYQILGDEFVELAFKFAAEADPDAELYYNDYSMALEGRRNGVIRMVKNLQSKGLKIDGIGMQGHLLMDSPTLEAYEESILAYSGLGVKVMITELDLSALPWPARQQGADIALRAEYEARMNPYTEGLTDSASVAWNQRMGDFFSLFLKHQDKISRVTLWGVTDNQSWKNNFPMRGRTDYPLLFDRNYQPKPVVERIIKEAKAK
ncbi:MAG: endo-1,4-beta-xylanase [Bacteroidota bacterium]